MKKFFRKKLNILAGNTFSALVKCSVFVFGLLIMLLASNINKIDAASLTICDGNDKTNSTYTTSMDVWICQIDIANPVNGGYHVTYGIDGGFIFSDYSYTADVFSGMYDPAGIRSQLGGAMTPDTFGLNDYTANNYVYGFVSFVGDDVSTTGTGSSSTSNLMANKIINVKIEQSFNSAASLVSGSVMIGMIQVCVYNGDPYSSGSYRYTQTACDTIEWGTLAQRYPNPPIFGATYMTNPETFEQDSTGARWGYINSPSAGLVLEANRCSHIQLYVDSVNNAPFTTLNCTKMASGYNYWDSGDITLPALSNGTHTLYARAYNPRGLYTQAQISFVYDVIDPEVYEFYLADGNGGQTDTTSRKNNNFEMYLNENKIWSLVIKHITGNVIYSVSKPNISNGEYKFTGNFTFSPLVYDQTLQIIVEDWAGNIAVSKFYLHYVEPTSLAICDGNNPYNKEYNTYVGGAYICELPNKTYTFNTLSMDGIYIFSDENYPSTVWANNDFATSLGPVGLQVAPSGAYPNTDFTQYSSKDYYYSLGSYIASEAEISHEAYEGQFVRSLAFLEMIERALEIVDGAEVIIGETVICATTTSSISYCDEIFWQGGELPSAPSITSFTVTGNASAVSGYTNTTTVSVSITMQRTASYSYSILDKVGSSSTYIKETTGTLSATISVTLQATNGTHTLTLTVQSGTGSDTATATIILDTVAPTVSSFTATGNSGAVSGYTSTNNVSLSFTASDNISATSNLKYKLSDALCPAIEGDYAAQKPTQITLCATGTHTIEIYVKDQAGNTTTNEEYTFTIVYDTTAPSITAFTLSDKSTGTIEGNVLYTKRNILSPTITVSDASPLYYAISNTNKSSYSTTKPTSATLSSTTEGSRVITLSVKDYAGNVSTKTFSVFLDITAPTVSIKSGSSNISTAINGGTEVTSYIDDTNLKSSKTSEKALSIASSTQLTSVQVTSRMAEAANSHTAPYTAKSMSYYVYALYSSTLATDKAGNTIVGYNFTVTYNNVTYYVKEFVVSINPNVVTSGVIGNDFTVSDTTSTQGNQYSYQTGAGSTGKIVVVQINNCVNGCSIASLISQYGLTLVGESPSSTQSDYYRKMLIKYSGSMEFVDIIVINTTPRINSTNTSTSITIDKGEEISNIGLSFTSVDGEKLEVNTLITLDGVKVKEIDTNIPGVYNVRQIATDKNGKTTRVDKKITVLDEVVQEEVIVKEEVIEVVEEILVPIVNNGIVENITNTESVATVVEEIPEVEMHIEKKIKVRGYQKRKEIRKTKKEKFSFKLFSKYFFKIYDG